jgi:hypothetical protein
MQMKRMCDAEPDPGIAAVCNNSAQLNDDLKALETTSTRTYSLRKAPRGHRLPCRAPDFNPHAPIVYRANALFVNDFANADETFLSAFCASTWLSNSDLRTALPRRPLHLLRNLHPANGNDKRAQNSVSTPHLSPLRSF